MYLFFVLYFFSFIGVLIWTNNNIYKNSLTRMGMLDTLINFLYMKKVITKFSYNEHLMFTSLLNFALLFVKLFGTKIGIFRKNCIDMKDYQYICSENIIYFTNNPNCNSNWAACLTLGLLNFVNGLFGSVHYIFLGNRDKNLKLHSQQCRVWSDCTGDKGLSLFVQAG